MYVAVFLFFLTTSSVRGGVLVLEARMWIYNVILSTMKKCEILK
ncbi:unnamed protein product, partial [Brassica napus]